MQYNDAKFKIYGDVNHNESWIIQMIKGSQLANKGQYKRMIGKVIYFFHSEPGIAYAVGIVSRFMHNLKYIIWRLQQES